MVLVEEKQRWLKDIGIGIATQGLLYSLSFNLLMQVKYAAFLCTFSIL